MRIAAGWVGAMLLAVCSVAGAAEFETPVAIIGGTVVTAPGAHIEAGTVLVEQGRIVEAGERVRIPEEARIIDASGMWLYAGFIDAATHAGIAEQTPGAAAMARLRDQEVDVQQAPRTAMQLANRKGVWPHLTVEELYAPDTGKLAAYRKSGFTTALVVPRPAILGGAGSVVQLSGAALRQAIVQADVAQITSFTWPSDGDFRRIYPSSRMGAVALLRQTFLDAAWYREQTALWEKAPTRAVRPVQDPVLVATGRLLDGEQALLFAVDSANEIHHALDLADELGQRLIILGGREAWKVADRLAATEASVIARLDWPEKPKLAPEKPEEKEADTEEDSSNALRPTRTWSKAWEKEFFEPLALREERVRLWGEQVDNVAHLLEAGVTVAVTGLGGDGPGEVLKKLREAMEHALTEEQALALLTTHPASIFGVDKQLGRVQKGGIANLTVLTAPLGEEQAKVRYVFIDGERFEFDATGGEDDKEEEGEEGEEEAEEESPEEKTPEDVYAWASELAADRVPSLQTGGTVLLRHANVITVTNGVLEDTDVAVHNGKIFKIGRDLRAPRGAKILDLTGYWLMPGIVDPHSHIAATSINEGSQSVTAEVRLADVVNHQDRSIYYALAGGVTTVHLMHGSANPIGGQNVVLKLKYNSSPGEMVVDSGPRLVKFALGENVTRANSRARGERFPGTRMGVESVFRQSFNDALAYRAQWDDYRRGQQSIREVPRTDLRMEALNDILAGDIWVHSHGYRSDEFLRLLQVAEDYGIRIACLQHILEGYRILPEMLRHGAAGSTFADFWAYKVEASQAIPQNAAMMMKAGIVSSLNSDSADMIRRMNLEAGKSMRFGGLSADDALRLITINPAIQIGLDDQIGSIEVGKDGDLAVFTRHPLDSFTRNVLTLIEGEVWYQDEDYIGKTVKRGPGAEWLPEAPRDTMTISSSAEDRYLITGATVHPVSGPPIADGVVAIANGEIRYVGKPHEDVREGRVIDATGLQVYPGMINAASDLGLYEIGSISGTRDAQDIARFQPANQTLSAVHPHSVHHNITRAEGITLSAALPQGGVIAGRGGVFQMEGWTMPEMLRAAEVGLVVSLPTLPTDLDKENRDERISDHGKAMKEIEEYFERAQHYAQVKGLSEENEAPTAKRDVQLEAMVPYVAGDAPVLFRANSYKEIMGALRFAETYELRPVIVGGQDAWKCAAALKAQDVPVIMTSVLSRPGEFDPYDAAYANAGKLEAAGVRFCIAVSSAADVKQLPSNLGMAVAHGLSEDGAVRSATLSAAEILGIDEDTGSLEVGKVADIIITTGHLGQANTRTVASFIAGKPVPLTSLHEENYQRFRHRPAPELGPKPELAGPPPMRLDP